MSFAASALWLTLIAAAPADGKARIEDLRLSLDGTRVLVSFQLANAFDEDLGDRLQSGLPSAFLYKFRLYRDHIRWFDKKLDTTRLQVVGIYNAVTREYLVNYKLDGNLIESRIVTDLNELEEAMTRFEKLPIFDLAGVSSHKRLLVRAEADIGSRTILFLIPARKSTDSAESRKFRIPADPQP